MATRTATIVITARDLASGKIAGIAGTLKSLGAIAGAVGVVAIGRQLVTAMADAVNVAADFEFSLSKVKAVSGATAAQMAALEQQALDLGRTTVFTAREAAEAQANFARAGFTVREIYGALPGTLDLAAAGELRVAEAARISSNILRAFGLEASRAGDVADLLAKTANSANTTVEELGNAFAYAAPAATVVGASMTDAAAAMALLADRGITASVAGTALRKTYATFAGELDPTAEGLGRLSERMFDSEGRFVGLAEAMRLMSAAGLQASDAYKLFGDRAGNAMAILMRLGPEALEKRTADLLDRAGTAAEVAAARLDNLEGAQVRLKSAAESLQIAIGKTFQGLLQEVLDDVITPAISHMAQAAGSTRDFEIAVLDLGIAAAGAAEAIEPLLQWALLLGKITVKQKLEEIRAELTLLGIAAGPLMEHLLGVAVPALGESTFGKLKTDLMALRAEAVAFRRDLGDDTGGGSGGQSPEDIAAPTLKGLRIEEDAALRLFDILSARAGEYSQERLEYERRRLQLQHARELADARQENADLEKLQQAHTAELQQLDLDFALARIDVNAQAAQSRVDAELRAEAAIISAMEAGRGTAEDIFQARLAFIARQRDAELAANDEWVNLQLDSTELTEEAKTEAVREWEEERTRIHAEAEGRRTQLTLAETRRQQAARIAYADAAVGFLRTAFGQSKAIAIAQVAIDTARSVMNIMAEWAAAPPVAAKLTAWAIATGAAQAAVIMGTDAGFASGGIVGRGPLSALPSARDTVQARLAPGETVLDTRMEEARALLGGRAAIVPAGMAGLGGMFGGGPVTIIIDGDVIDPDQWARRNAKYIARGSHRGGRLRTRVR